MKKLGLTIALIALSIPAAYADAIAKKGAKASLEVDYVFTSSGAYFSSSKDQKRKWNVKRVVHVTADYEADAGQPFGALHKNDKDQQQNIKNLQAKATATQAKMQPTMADMMKIVEQCKEDEACISKRVSDYGNNMQAPTDMNATREAINDMAQPGTPRFQLWRSKSQGGTYSITEEIEFKPFDLTCPGDKYCTRTTITKGGGAIPAPPGGRSVAGASMFEVDNRNSDLVLMLPVPLAALPTETNVTTNIAHDPNIGGKGFAKPLVVTVKPITVTLTNGQIGSSGTERIPIDGKFEEGGLLTISWSLKSK
jgi:hypothetical protein